MDTKFVAWGHPVSSSKKSSNYVYLDECSGRREVKKVYMKGDCILKIINDELKQEGVLDFEKSGRADNSTNQNKFSKDIKLVSTSNTYEKVKDVAIGDNHFLILSTAGNVYSFGDNYFGQLGLNNPFAAKIFEPKQIPKLSDIKAVFAYKNNSFAIDANNKLWVWGKAEYLGNGSKANMFKPILVLSKYNIKDLKVNDGRVVVSMNSDTLPIQQSDLTETAQDKKQEEKTTDTVKHEESSKPTDKGGKNEIAEESKKSDKGVDLPSQINLTGINSAIKTMNNHISEITSGLTHQKGDKSDLLKQIRTRVLSGHQKITKTELQHIWEEINSVLDESLKSDRRQNNLKERIDRLSEETVSTSQIIQVFDVYLKSVITGCFHEMDIEQLLTVFSSYEKDTSQILSGMKLEDKYKDENMISLFKNIQFLLTYFLKYKKLETLIHKMAGHTFLLKSFHFQQVLEGLKHISKDENAEAKLYLVEKTFQNLQNLVELTNQSMKNIQNVYDNFDMVNLKNEDPESEKFLYKHVIQSSLDFKDLWSLIILHIKNETQANEKVEQIKKVIDVYKLLYSSQLYLRTISLKTIFKNEKVDLYLNKTEEKQLIKQINLFQIQVDGVISKVEAIIQETIKKSAGLKIDNFSKELVIMYATSILDCAYHKKIIFQLVVRFISIMNRLNSFKIILLYKFLLSQNT